MVIWADGGDDAQRFSGAVVVYRLGDGGGDADHGRDFLLSLLSFFF